MHEPPFAIVPLGLLVMAKVLSPLIATEAMTKSEVPVFLIAAYLTVKATQIDTVPKLMVAGDTDILGGTHVPFGLTVEVASQRIEDILAT